MAVPLRLHLLARRRGDRGTLSASQQPELEDGTPRDYRGTTLLRATMLCRCPRCGHGSVFSGILAVNFRCRACGLDLTRYNIGDGPSATLVAVWAALLAAIAIWVEISLDPSYWLHVTLWPALMILLVYATVRPLKAWFIAMGYFYRTGKIRL